MSAAGYISDRRLPSYTILANCAVSELLVIISR